MKIKDFKKYTADIKIKHAVPISFYVVLGASLYLRVYIVFVTNVSCNSPKILCEHFPKLRIYSPLLKTSERNEELHIPYETLPYYCVYNESLISFALQIM
jgi:hypothetical protein